MRNFILTALSAAFLIGMADPAEARRGGGKSQDMLFVAPTKIERDGTSLALCHLVNDRSVLFINVTRSIEGYVLAPDKCVGESYFPMSVQDMTAAKRAGLIDISIPSEPKLSTNAMVSGHWGLALIAGALGFLGLGAVNASKRRKQRRSMMGNASPAAMAVLDAMCHAAKADGYVSPSEVAEITDAAQKMTDEQFDPRQVQRMAQLAEANPSDKDFKRLVGGRTPAEKDVMMKGVLMVVAADGRLDGKEQQFVGKLAQAMMMSGQQVQQILAEVVGSRMEQAPA